MKFLGRVARGGDLLGEASVEGVATVRPTCHRITV
jgi:hypothetical protein